MQKWTAISVKLQFKWEILFQKERPIRRWHPKMIWKSKTNSVAGNGGGAIMMVIIITHITGALLLPLMFLRSEIYLNKHRQQSSGPLGERWGHGEATRVSYAPHELMQQWSGTENELHFKCFPMEFSIFCSLWCWLNWLMPCNDNKWKIYKVAFSHRADKCV